MTGNLAKKVHTDMVIVKADVAYASVIAQLARQTFIESFEYVYNDHPGVLARYLENTFADAKVVSSLEKAHNHYYLAMVDGVAAAYMKFKENSSADCIKDAKQIQLQKIYVKKEYQSQNLGGAMMDIFMDFAESQKPVMLWLAVLDRNEGAHRFYERYGFACVGESYHDFEELKLRFDVMSLGLKKFEG